MAATGGGGSGGRWWLRGRPSWSSVLLAGVLALHLGQMNSKRLIEFDGR